MNQLPDEVLLNVFSYVPNTELMAISQVCRRWKDVVTDPSLYRTLDLVNDDPDTGTAIRLLSAARWLTSLKLYGRTDTDILLQHIGLNHPRLVKLVFEKCRGSPSKENVSAMQLRYLVRRCSTLQQFSLLGTLCNSKVLHTEIGENLHDLRVIEILKSLCFDSNFLNIITNNCIRIEKLRVTYRAILGLNIFTQNAVVNFCDKFKESLTSLELYTSWTNVNLPSLSRCRNIKELTLRSFTGTSEEEIMSLCQMSKLESLFISILSNTITSAGWVRLFDNTSMTSLVKLHLCNTNVDDLVISAISLLPNLTDLGIMNGTKVSDEGLLSLSNIPNLARLRIYYNWLITSHGWISFLQTITVQQKITHLQLVHCNYLNLEVAKGIVQNLPQLQQLELSR